MQLHRLLRRLGIVVFSLLAVCRANADLYVTASALLLTTGGARFNETTGVLLGSFASGLAPTGLAFGPDGNLYLAVDRFIGFEVDRFDRFGNLLGVVVPTIGPGLDITDLTFGPDGNLYMAVTNESSENSVIRLNVRTGRLETFVNLLSRANFMTFGPDGNLYITPNTCGATFCVERVNATTRQVSPFITTSQGMFAGIRFGPDRLLYVVHNVDLISPSGNLIHAAQVERYDLAGRGGIFIPAANPPLGAATNLAFGHDGSLYVLDVYANNVVRFRGTTGAVFAHVPDTIGSGPAYLAFSPPPPPPAVVPAGWIAAGVADFNGDGHPDYLLFNSSTRQTAIWYLNNNVRITGQFGPTLPAGWSVVGVADFNGDGHPDYLLLNSSTRQTAIWYLNNNVLTSGRYGPTLPGGWSVLGVADFNGDGHPDYLLFSSSTRQTAIWYLNNNVFGSGLNGPTLPAGWSVVGVADFNGDGHPDYLLFSSSTRQTAIWYLNDNVFSSGLNGPTLPVSWTVVGVTDFNGDGHPDYLLFSSSTRQTAIWYLNNNVLLSGAVVVSK